MPLNCTLQDYVRAVLVGARPGLAAASLQAQDASGLMARRLAAYTAGLALLGAGQQDGGGGSGDGAGAGADGRELEEKKASALVSALEAELGGITSVPDLTEVGAAPTFIWACAHSAMMSCLDGTCLVCISSAVELSGWARVPGVGPAFLPAYALVDCLSACFAAANCQITEKVMEVFEAGSPLGCVALELLPKAVTLLQVGRGLVPGYMRSRSACSRAVRRLQASGTCRRSLQVTSAWCLQRTAGSRHASRAVALEPSAAGRQARACCADGGRRRGRPGRLLRLYRHHQPRVPVQLAAAQHRQGAGGAARLPPVSLGPRVRALLFRLALIRGLKSSHMCACRHCPLLCAPGAVFATLCDAPPRVGCLCCAGPRRGLSGWSRRPGSAPGWQTCRTCPPSCTSC